MRFLGADMSKRGCFGRFLVDDSSTLSLDLFPSLNLIQIKDKDKKGN